MRGNDSSVINVKGGDLLWGVLEDFTKAKKRKRKKIQIKTFPLPLWEWARQQLPCPRLSPRNRKTIRAHTVVISKDPSADGD